jgi:hypothetical protein
MQECGLHAFANNIKIPATLTWRRCPWRRRHGKGVGMAEPDETTVQTHLTCPHCGGALTIQMRGRLRVWDSATGLEPPKPPRWLGKEMISLSPPPRRTGRAGHLAPGSSNLRTPKGALML